MQTGAGFVEPRGGPGLGTAGSSVWSLSPGLLPRPEPASRVSSVAQPFSPQSQRPFPQSPHYPRLHLSQ